MRVTKINSNNLNCQPLRELSFGRKINKQIVDRNCGDCIIPTDKTKELKLNIAFRVAAAKKIENKQLKAIVAFQNRVIQCLAQKAK